MAAEREAPTPADYVVTALSPILIMLMVGSLVFFLVEVMYEGKYSGRLLYTLFFFVVGAVLVARISIEVDASRASMYGLLLGIVTYLALLSYVEYPGGGWLKSFGWLVNLGLLTLIWWSAHKLTWDCTNIDEKRKGGGRGVLSAAGLDADAGSPATSTDPSTTKDKKPKKKKRGKHDSRLWDWIGRYQKHRDAERKGPHTPGVWVLYFALAALPLFALGQSLVGPEDADRRQATFLQMMVYVGSALALLVTTSFLALRRYLRQRKAKVPAALTASWLGFGALLIVVFLVLGAFLPRPHSEVPWFGISRAGKSDREASRYAVNRGSAGKGEGASGEKTESGDGNASAKGGKPGGGSKGEKGSGSGQMGKSSSGKNGKSQGGKAGGQDSRNKSSDDQGKEKADDNSDEDKDKSEREGKTDREADDAKDKSESRDKSSSDTSSKPQLGGMLEKIASVVKWIVYAIVAILVIGGIALAILKYLAPFTEWAQRLLDSLRNWWANLFGGRKGVEAKKEAKAAEPAGPIRPPPFHEFPNPFADGSAGRREAAELTDYTFLALDAWAWDHDCGREQTETPLEFANRLSQEFPELSELLGQFVKLYARMTYSEFPLPKNTKAVLEQVWEGMIHGVAVG